MIYQKTYNKQQPKSTRCSECHSSLLLFSGGRVTCKNCGHVVFKPAKRNKYGAVKTEFNGRRFDSKFEASVAEQLEMRKRVGDILDYDCQFRVEGWTYNKDGTKGFYYRHKVDFRLHLKDGSFELLEAKGIETQDYLWRKKCLENHWLKEHPDHIYTVIKQRNFKTRK